MKLTLSWLKDHLETAAALNEIAAAMTDLGLEVESIDNPAAKLGPFVVAYVIEAARVPGSDHLNLCKVDPGTGAPVQVICGAPNARTGMKGVFAPAGTFIPGTGKLLKPGKLMGYDSNGMLCSERELELSDEHNGIIELPSDAPVGMRFIDYKGMNDATIDFKITPNRPDALAVRGVARDLAARGLGKLKPAPAAALKGAFESPVKVILEDDVKDAACPHFVGVYLRGVKNGASPAWMQERLKAIGLRPINALVDVTNYLTFDRARPLHVYDAGKLKGDIAVRLARGGEMMEALDGKTYAAPEGVTLICDDAGPVGFGAIMGGAASGCDEATTDVFLEGAYFDPIRTATSGRRLNLRSDARYRFERGIDPAFTREGVESAARMILEICGGEASAVVEAGAAPVPSRAFSLRTGRVESLVGMAVAPAEQQRILEALGFGVFVAGEGFTVHVPSWRPDVHGEADLVEEIARVASLSGLQAAPMERPAGVAKPVLTLLQKRTAAARRALAAAGMNEAVSYSFISADHAALFGGGADEMKLANPIASDMSDMRPSPLPGLLAAAARNQARGFMDLALFEVGPEFFGPEPGDQREVAAGVLIGQTAPRGWTGARRPYDAFDAKAMAEAALASIGVPAGNLMVAREAPAWMHPGRSAAMKLGPKSTLAIFGELHPRILEAFDLRGPAMAFVAYLEAAPAPKAAKTRARPPLTASDYQAVERDFAFVVDARTEAEGLLKAIRGVDKALIESVQIFDQFGGAKAEAQFGPGKKSLAVSVRLQPKDKTLMDAEIEALSARVVAAAAKAGAALRS